MKQLVKGVLDNYESDNFHYDEVFGLTKEPKDHYKTIVDRFNQLNLVDYERINNDVKTAFFNQGITFAVYSDDNKPNERIFPFDLFPRIIPKEEWMKLETGIIQRNKAINLFPQTNRALQPGAPPFFGQETNVQNRPSCTYPV